MTPLSDLLLPNLSLAPLALLAPLPLALFGGTCAGGSLLFSAYQLARLGMQPTSQLFGRTVIDGPDSDPGRHTVALTYDDGPSPRNTPALLDLLAAHGVHATFFCIGNHVRRHPELARRLHAAGHTIGNHTLTHPNLALLRPSRVRQEIADCQSAIADITGALPTLFRPPFGARRPDVLRSARALGLTPVLWNITAGDWLPTPAEALLATVDTHLHRNRERRRTSNLLLHDASHLDGTTPIPRDNALHLTRALLARPDLRFTTA